MTIRGYIKRRVRLSWLLMAVLLLTTSIAAALVSAFFFKLDMNLTTSIMIPVVMGFIFWRLLHIKCPRCHKSVGLAAAMEQTDLCPHCEVSFDQPAIPAAAILSAATANPVTIRKYVRQRAIQVQMYLMLGTVLVGITLITLFHLSAWAAIPLGLLTAAVGMFVAMAVAASTRCPRCSTPLRTSGASLMWKKPANKCTTCGVNFDEPIPTRIE